MGIYKASYNRISKSSFTSPRENIKRLSEKIFSPLLIQRKNRTPLCAGKTKKTYTSTHNETRGAVCIPASSYCTCMYRSSLFVYVCFYPTASWVLYLNTEFFICPVRMKKYFSLSTLEQILIHEKSTPPESPMAFFATLKTIFEDNSCLCFFEYHLVDVLYFLIIKLSFAYGIRTIVIHLRHRQYRLSKP